MFRFRFFRPLAAQRRELLAATEFEPIPLHPAVQRQLDLARCAGSAAPARIRSIAGLFLGVLSGLRELVIENVAWNLLSALIVLAGVLLAREVFQAEASLGMGLALTALYLVLRLLQAAIEYLNSRRRLQFHRGVQVTLYRILNEKLSSISPAGRAKFSKGQLKTIVGSDVESVEDFLSASLQQWIPLLASLAVILPAVWIVSGTVGLLALASVLALVPVAVTGAFILERFQRISQAQQDDLATAIGEWVKNIRLVRFLGWGNAVRQEVSAKMDRYVLSSALRHAVVLFVWALSVNWSMVPLLVIIWFSTMQEQPLNLLEVFSSFWLLECIISQIQYIPHSLTMFGAAAAGAHRMVRLLEQPELRDSLVPAGAAAIAPDAVAQRIVLRDVRVTLGACAALGGVSATLSLRERTAIVGPVGSGKTTLLEALIGELPITSGSIEVEFSDGSVAPLWRADAYARLRSQAAYSPQQPFLSNSSMALNIDLSGQAPLEEVQMALAAAQLTEDLALFPRGLSEEVGESGINLSGGQRQRVSLARAFLSRRPIMVLDDPLSAVDPETERALVAEILERCAGLVLVSHRLAELERCERVIVLDAGRIVEDGDPKELSRNPSSRFRRFLDAAEEHGH